MNTTHSLTIPNSIINISSSTAAGPGDPFGTMEYMSDLNKIGYVWC